MRKKIAQKRPSQLALPTSITIPLTRWQSAALMLSALAYSDGDPEKHVRVMLENCLKGDLESISAKL